MDGVGRDHYSYAGMYDAFFQHCEALVGDKVNGWCCVAIDIEQFKLFNEVYGRERGTALLHEIAKVLEPLEARGDAATCYLGRDDFAVFMRYDEAQMEQLLAALKHAVNTVGSTAGFLPAIGVYKLVPGDSIDLEMYDKAAAAMQDAKHAGQKRIHLYDVSIHEKEKREFKQLNDLRAAMEAGEITFYLQPQCRMETKQIVGAEALSRWVRSDGTVVSPGTYIPLLEQKGLIADFDRHVWQQVFRWLHQVMDRGVEPVPVSINVSQTDIRNLDMVGVLSGLCEQYGVAPRYVKVEITESSFAEEYDQVQTFVKLLQSKGFLVMMDDFGSGYSSLNMLENITVDVLKLDMAFMKEDNLRSRRSVTIVESIVNMAKMMGLPIVVEGVETEEQVRFLRDLGCQYAQGYHFYRPMPVQQFEMLLMAEGVPDHHGFTTKMNEQFHVREFIDEHTFTDTMLNNILGAVAFYDLEGKDLTITRFNEQFYRAIGDAFMEARQAAIQNYVVREDWPSLYKALDDAYENLTAGGTCEVRFYKSDGGVFWFRIHFFYLRTEQQRRIYYGQVEDVTEMRQQSLQFFEVLHEQADVTMTINLDQRRVRYINNANSLAQLGLPSLALEDSVQRTIQNRIDNEVDKQKFRDFFSVEHLRDAHRRAIYHETLVIPFRLRDKAQPVEFSTYYIRYSKEQDLIVYVFTKGLEE